MRLVSVWLHVLGIVAWIGGLAYQAHVLGPAARRGGAGVFAQAPPRGRPIAWTAGAGVALTGLYNVTRLRPPQRGRESRGRPPPAGGVVPGPSGPARPRPLG